MASAMILSHVNRVAFLLPVEYQSSWEYFQRYITPKANACYKDSQYVLNPTEGRFDALVVYQSVKPLNRTFRLEVPPTNTLLVLMEPPEILSLPDAYTNQFYSVLGQAPYLRCRNPILSHSAHHWFIERPYQKVLDTSDINKTGLISAIISSKQDTIGHQKRWNLVSQLKEHFGERLHWYGRGVQELKLKIDGVEPYKYHVVLENCSCPHYWTEKLADAFVANSFPFYWGDPRVGEDFPEGSFLSIDPDNPARAIRVIEEAIDHDVYSSCQLELSEARRRLTELHHPYEVYRRIFQSTPDSSSSLVEIQPHTNFEFSLRQKIRFRWRKICPSRSQH